MPTVTREIWKCCRCGHEWMSRDGETPLRCARCKSAYWDRAPKNPKAGNHSGKLEARGIFYG